MKRTLQSTTALILAAVLLLTHADAMAQPSQVSYQGELRTQGSVFDGFAAFKCAIVTDGGATTLWSNDGTSVAGSEPTQQVILEVTDGIFSVMLGSAPQEPISGGHVAGVTEADLRVWVNTSDGFEQMPDQPVGSALISLLDNPKVSFSARSFTWQLLTGGTLTRVEFGTEDISGPWFNNDTFTAPVAGVYDFDMRVGWSQTGSSTIDFWIYVNDSAELKIISDNADRGNGTMGYRLSLAAGDEMEIRVYSDDAFYRVGSNNIGGNLSMFSGHLVHQ